MRQHQAESRAGPDPAEAERVLRQHRNLVEQSGTAILNVIPGLVVILNDRSRIVIPYSLGILSRPAASW